MTQIQFYGDLKWPEVKELPSNAPIVLPFGFDYDIVQICTELGNPPLLILLPPLPYGWKNSYLEINQEIYINIVGNLLTNLSDDGFQNVFIDPPVEIPFIKGNTLLYRIKKSYAQSPVLSEESGSTEKLIIIPTGHVEQHSLHLPMLTDTIIIEAISKGIVKLIPELCTMLPVMPYGVSTHRSSFFGTFNAGGREYEDFWLDVIQSLVKIGYKRIYFVNGHGGNSSFLTNVVKYVGEKHPGIFCATSWLYLSGPDGIKSLDKHRDSPIGGMGHAGELETSLMLHLKNELVDMKLVKDDTEFISTPSYYMDWIEGGSLIANPPWYDDSRFGAYGAGSLASAEKGSIWLKDAIDEKISHIYEINLQQTEREERRKSGFGEWGYKNSSTK